MSNWTKGWWVLAAAFELVILAGVVGASIAAAWTWLVMIAGLYAVVHLCQAVGDA